MDIISKNHFQVINEINEITNFSVYYGGSLEDYLLLGSAEKPIGDLDVIIYDDDVMETIKRYFDLTDGTPSYFNRMMMLKQVKYVKYLNNGLKIDFMHVIDSPYTKDDYMISIYYGIPIAHLKFDKKVKLINEWIDNSQPHDMWAFDKFSKLLKRYEDINN